LRIARRRAGNYLVDRFLPLAYLSHIFGGGDKKEEPKGAGAQKYDPNRPPNATGQVNEPAASEVKEEKKSPLKKIFGIFGGKKKPEPGKTDPGQPNPNPTPAKPDKGDSP